MRVVVSGHGDVAVAISISLVYIAQLSAVVQASAHLAGVSARRANLHNQAAEHGHLPGDVDASVAIDCGDTVVIHNWNLKFQLVSSDQLYGLSDHSTASQRRRR